MTVISAELVAHLVGDVVDRVGVTGRVRDAGTAHGLLHASDDAAREDAEQQERALFYVALTRARREVLVTSHGTPSAWLESKRER